MIGLSVARQTKPTTYALTELRRAPNLRDLGQVHEHYTRGCKWDKPGQTCATPSAESARADDDPLVVVAAMMGPRVSGWTCLFEIRNARTRLLLGNRAPQLAASSFLAVGGGSALFALTPS
jgi:hypothetical protein